MITIIFIFAVFISVWFTIINTSKMMLKLGIPASNLFLQALGITVIISLYVLGYI